MHVGRRDSINYLHVISWVLGQGSDGEAVVDESVYHLLRAEADYLHMAATANKQPPAHTNMTHHSGGVGMHTSLVSAS